MNDNGPSASQKRFNSQSHLARMPFFVKGERMKEGSRVGPDAIRQSNLGICWLYDAIQSIARLGVVFAPGDSPSAVYKVIMWDPATARYRPMFVDDRMPGMVNKAGGV